jgi:hypothetical protein
MFSESKPHESQPNSLIFVRVRGNHFRKLTQAFRKASIVIIRPTIQRNSCGSLLRRSDYGFEFSQHQYWLQHLLDSVREHKSVAVRNCGTVRKPLRRLLIISSPTSTTECPSSSFQKPDALCNLLKPFDPALMDDTRSATG